MTDRSDLIFRRLGADPSKPDARIGICTELLHSWWFPIGPGERSCCPEPGCTAEVKVYAYETTYADSEVESA